MIYPYSAEVISSPYDMAKNRSKKLVDSKYSSEGVLPSNKNAEPATATAASSINTRSSRLGSLPFAQKLAQLGKSKDKLSNASKTPAKTRSTAKESASTKEKKEEVMKDNEAKKKKYNLEQLEMKLNIPMSVRKASRLHKINGWFV